MEKTYQIITDATADLNAELMQESGLEMLPMDVEIEGKRYSYAPERPNSIMRSRRESGPAPPRSILSSMRAALSGF